MKTKDWVVNALIAALYVVLTVISAPIAYGAVQFRLSEVLNHLVVFDKKYLIGIAIGVIVANLFSPLLPYDLIFGLLHSLFALVTTIFITKKVKNMYAKMVVNALSFGFYSFIIAFELYMFGGVAAFWYTWFTVALGEVVVMVIGAPIMKIIDDRVDFKAQINA